mmetsp:Transcript_4328/g.6454  ORF Transcript_4328/g.6454 Transcript_4328/m.6454 type:complete len:134 (+) Transcript_4328:74-475(+)
MKEMMSCCTHNNYTKNNHTHKSTNDQSMNENLFNPINNLPNESKEKKTSNKRKSIERRKMKGNKRKKENIYQQKKNTTTNTIYQLKNVGVLRDKVFYNLKTTRCFTRNGTLYALRLFSIRPREPTKHCIWPIL